MFSKISNWWFQFDQILKPCHEEQADFSLPKIRPFLIADVFTPNSANAIVPIQRYRYNLLTLLPVTN